MSHSNAAQELGLNFLCRFPFRLGPSLSLSRLSFSLAPRRAPVGRKRLEPRPWPCLQRGSWPWTSQERGRSTWGLMWGFSTWTFRPSFWMGLKGRCFRKPNKKDSQTRQRIVQNTGPEAQDIHRQPLNLMYCRGPFRSALFGVGVG